MLKTFICVEDKQSIGKVGIRLDFWVRSLRLPPRSRRHWWRHCCPMIVNAPTPWLWLHNSLHSTEPLATKSLLPHPFCAIRCGSHTLLDY